MLPSTMSVSYMEQGRLEEAVAAFREALKMTSAQLQNVPEEKVNVSAYHRSEGTRRLSSPQSWISNEVSSKGSPFLVYSSAEKIRQESLTLDESCTSSISTPFLSIVTKILFNLSLTYHMKAMTSHLPEPVYGNALQLYEHTYNVIAQSQGMGDFLRLAILNDVAHIHYKTRDFVAAERSCGLLWRAVLDMEGFESRMSPIVEGFCKNVIHVTFNCSQPAAAA